jgi:hypothetical protein
MYGGSVALPLASALTAFALETVGGGYIYGASGQTCTINFRYGRASIYPDMSELILGLGRQWDGRPVYDCIGLVKAFAARESVDTSLLTRNEITTKSAFRLWVSESGSIIGATLQPGMLLFRLEGDSPVHVGIYVGDGRVVHARGTRWGVVEEAVPAAFTHWALLKWIYYNLPPDDIPAVAEPFLKAGDKAIVQTDDALPVPVSPVEYTPGSKRPSIGKFADGAVLTVLAVVNDVCRLAEGIGTNGLMLRGYVRLVDLRPAEDL